MFHLVLADDSVTIRKVVELSFADENFEVHTFSDGASALQYLRSRPVDVLLADVSLPFMDGYDLCREVRQGRRTANVPVILLAGTFEPFDAHRAERAGYNGHLTKPFETSQLVGMVKDLLATVPPPEPEELPEPPEDEEPVEEPVPAVTIPGLMFTIPFKARKGSDDVLFRLEMSECRPDFSLLRREVVLSSPQTSPKVIEIAEPLEEPSVSAAPEVPEEEPEIQTSDFSDQEIEALTQKILERLPEELRRMLPGIARDVLSTRE